MSDATTEEWKPIPGFEGYEASNLGRVRSWKRVYPRILRTTRSRNGYINVALYSNGIGRPYGVHRMVLLAFVGGPPSLEHQACHNDGNKGNNFIGNLRWGTASENSMDIVDHGHHFNANKTHCPAGHEYDSVNTHIKRDGSRICKTCNRNRAREWYRKRVA